MPEIDKEKLFCIGHSRLGETSLCATPKSEYLSAFYAGAAFQLFGKTPLASETPPLPDTPVGSDVSYLLRTGQHDLLAADWQHYLSIADRVFNK